MQINLSSCGTSSKSTCTAFTTLETKVSLYYDQNENVFILQIASGADSKLGSDDKGTRENETYLGKSAGALGWLADFRWFIQAYCQPRTHPPAHTQRMLCITHCLVERGGYGCQWCSQLLCVRLCMCWRVFQWGKSSPSVTAVRVVGMAVPSEAWDPCELCKLRHGYHTDSPLTSPTVLFLTPVFPKCNINTQAYEDHCTIVSCIFAFPFHTSHKNGKLYIF